MSRLLQPRSLRALAFKLADENAICTVHSACAPADDFNADEWKTGCHRAWFLPGPNDEGRADILEAVRYGVARGIFVRNRRAGLVVIAR